MMNAMVFEYQTIKGNQINEPSNAQRLFIRNQSHSLFKKMMVRGKFRKLINSFSRKSSRLILLSSHIHAEDSKNIFDCEMQSVPLNLIIGSENRCLDFDSQFAPQSFHTLERWVRISDLFLMNENIPPVVLIRVGDYYFVRDGHHRVSVAKALGKKYIDACVTLHQMKKSDPVSFVKNLGQFETPQVS